MAKLTRESIVPSLKQGFKVGLASLLTYASALALGLPSSYIGVVTAVIVLQAYVADSLQMAAYRMSGTLVGALISVLVLAVNPGGDVYTGLFLFVALAFCGFLTSYAPQFRMAAITVSIVFLMGVHSEDWRIVAIDRVVEIALGIACAVLVSLTVWPQRASALLRETLGRYFRDAALRVAAMTSHFLETQRAESVSDAGGLDALLAKSRDVATKAIVQESRIYPRAYQHVLGLMTTAERIHGGLHAMANALAAESGEPASFIMEPEMRELAASIEAALLSLADTAWSEHTSQRIEAVRGALDRAEARLQELRSLGTTRRFELAKLSQFYAFYHALRRVGEALTRN
ncbi:FUSC family protein [Desulfocurvibacter africanus]|uniref:FUSC family protein n=1 Tax=Desulfocurvibacter africanus TaxID=873 RepID=UPI000400B871|nr:FUSC family protein [Desulfocurvibacter africanus]